MGYLKPKLPTKEKTNSKPPTKEEIKSEPVNVIKRVDNDLLSVKEEIIDKIIDMATGGDRQMLKLAYEAITSLEKQERTTYKFKKLDIKPLKNKDVHDNVAHVNEQCSLYLSTQKANYFKHVMDVGGIESAHIDSTIANLEAYVNETKRTFLNTHCNEPTAHINGLTMAFRDEYKH